MSGTLAILMLAALSLFALLWKAPIAKPRHSSKLAAQLDKLWDISQSSLRDKKYLRAEKALLTILRVDERDARAYNRLGILYAKQHDYDDAIECFEIAQSLEPSASSLHNVGLIYYETKQYDKAAQAFEQALQIEEDNAARHIAYAKVLEALGRDKDVITELERAVELDANPQSVGILADALERDGNIERADKLHQIARKMRERGNRARIKQPGKVQI
jgi:superkiller protein 3